ncbi:MAG TPA: T9SS type A sorting domain-containing protein, partial [Chitinophagales bacterium]|nr:T9SS type A sorting domain-containing protein [Chitinophagales bacterium]
ITGTVGISSFDFDPQGGVYIAGASDAGPVQLGAQTFNATNTYNLFVAHLDSAQGNPWVTFAKDITFQSPKVDADPFGNAFVGGHVMDSLTLGNLQFNPPVWGTDFFLVKVNQQGNFIWGQQSPSMDSLSGEIEPASAKFIDTDTAGNVYLLANQRGVFNWGNGIESGNDGAPLNKSKVLVMKFDGADGTPLFALTAGLGSTNTHQLAVDQHKNIYFTQTLTDTAAYGYFTMNIPMYENHFLMAKLSYLEDTTISVSIDNLVANTFNVFPNPASTHVVVPQELQESELSVMDVTGKQVAHHQAVGNTMNVASLPSGVYMLLFKSDRVRYTGRLVKQ